MSSLNIIPIGNKIPSISLKNLSTNRFFSISDSELKSSSIISTLEDKNNLLKQETIEHSYPHCWRHKTPIIFRATPQWFISMENNKLREQALHAINQVNWEPSWGKERIHGMLENRPDWCISRQRTWGVPIPIFIHQETQELHPDTPNLILKAADLVEKNGINI